MDLNNRIYDAHRGEIACIGCGLVMAERMPTEENEVRTFHDEAAPAAERCNAGGKDTVEEGTAKRGNKYVGAVDTGPVWSGRERVRELRSAAALPADIDTFSSDLMRRFERLAKKQDVRVKASDPVVVMVVMVAWSNAGCGSPSLKRILTAINHINHGRNKVAMKHVYDAKKYLSRLDPNGGWLLPNIDQMTDLVQRTLMGLGTMSPQEHILFDKAFQSIEKLPLGRHRSYNAFLGVCLRTMRLSNLPFAVEWDDARIASVINTAPETIMTCMDDIVASVGSKENLVGIVRDSVGFG